MREAVIVDAVRTPIGRFLGGLASLKAPELGGIAVRAAGVALTRGSAVISSSPLNVRPSTVTRTSSPNASS